MKCPECGFIGEIYKFESDDLNCSDNIFADDYIHVCPICMFHFTKDEGV